MSLDDRELIQPLDSSSDIQLFYRTLEGNIHGVPHSYASLIGLPETETHSLLKRIKEGLEYHRLERLAQNFGLSVPLLAEYLQIPPRTLARRKEKGRLLPDESDRLLRVARIFGKALELFEADVPSARNWLSTPQSALGGEIPLALAQTDIGSREVEALMGRLEHGVFT